MAYASAARTFLGIASQRLHQLHQMAYDILKDRCIQLVIDLLALPFREYQSGVPKDPEMARNGRPARVKLVRNLP